MSATLATDLFTPTSIGAGFDGVEAMPRTVRGDRTENQKVGVCPMLQ